MKADNKSKSKESHLKCLMNEQSPGREKKIEKKQENRRITARRSNNNGQKTSKCEQKDEG